MAQSSAKTRENNKHKYGSVYHVLQICKCLHLRRTLHSATDVNAIYSGHYNSSLIKSNLTSSHNSDECLPYMFFNTLQTQHHQ